MHGVQNSIWPSSSSDDEITGVFEGSCMDNPVGGRATLLVQDRLEAPCSLTTGGAIIQKTRPTLLSISMSHVMRQFSLSLLNIKGLADCNLLFLSAMIGLDATSLQHYFVTYSSQHL